MMWVLSFCGGFIIGFVLFLILRKPRPRGWRHKDNS